MKILRTLLNVRSVTMIMLIMMLELEIIVISLEHSAHRDCNINLKLNDKILIVFHNLKDYDCHFIMQELGKFNLNINFIPNESEK